MKLSKLAGATSEIWQVFIRDSSSTTGAGLAGLAFNSASLTAYYHRDTDTTATAITLATMTVGTFTSSGFKEIDATNMPGWYQFCPPNAAIASGAKSCAFHLKGATNMAPLPIEVQLTAVNPDSATAFITGVNSLAPPTNWNLMSVDANGRVDVIKIAGTTQTARDIGLSVLLAAGQKVDVDTIKTNPVVNGGTFTFPTNSTGASTTNITAGTMTNLTNAPTAGDFTATMKTSLNAATPAVTVSDKTGFALTAAYDAAKTAAQAGDAMALTAGERNSAADALLNRNMATGTDSGSPTVRTPRQALRFLRNKWSISAGTLTVCAEDDTATSWTAAVGTDAAAIPIVSNDPA